LTIGKPDVVPFSINAAHLDNIAAIQLANRPVACARARANVEILGFNPHLITNLGDYPKTGRSFNDDIFITIRFVEHLIAIVVATTVNIQIRAFLRQNPHPGAERSLYHHVARRGFPVIVAHMVEKRRPGNRQREESGGKAVVYTAVRSVAVVVRSMAVIAVITIIAVITPARYIDPVRGRPMPLNIRHSRDGHRYRHSGRQGRCSHPQTPTNARRKRQARRKGDAVPSVISSPCIGGNQGRKEKTTGKYKNKKTAAKTTEVRHDSTSISSIFHEPTPAHEPTSPSV
jgi:hypothetical protein